MTGLSGVPRALYDALSDVSEMACGLRWAPGTEFEAWRLLLHPDGVWAGCSAVRAAAPLLLARALAAQSRLWVAWEGPGPVAVDLDEWKARYRAWTAAGRDAA